MFQTMQNFTDSVTVTNGNSIRQTIVTAILCIPAIPGGIVALWKYKDNVKINRNKYYNFNRFAQSINEQHGIGVFQRRGLFGIF